MDRASTAEDRRWYLTAEQEADAFDRWRSGDRAAGDAIARSVHQLVHDLVWRYAKRGVMVDELEGVAWMSVAQTMRRYVPDGARFSTMVWRNVTSDLRRFVGMNARQFRTPWHVLKAIAASGGLADVDAIAERQSFRRRTADAVVHLMRSSETSLDADGTVLAQVLESEAPGPDIQAEAREAATLLGVLSDRDRDMVLRRVVDGDEFGEIGAVHGISRQAAQQRIAGALRRMEEASRKLRVPKKRAA
jgi:DNA-directed RNA polymerase sigma subunit (sigma70/sigma32)